MSDQPTVPQHLDKAFQMLKGMAKEARRSAAKAARKNGKGRAPRQVCSCCSKVFDFAIIKVNAPVIGAVCSECKQTLAEGYTAFVSPSSSMFIKAPWLKDLAGKIEPMSEENMAKLKARFPAKKNETAN